MDQVSATIESDFRRLVRSDSRLRNAYLLVNSEKVGVDLLIAEGKVEKNPLHHMQPVHMASVGKLFTASLIGILCDQGKISFDDPIFQYLDDDLMNGLHKFKGKDYSHQIRISHLLMQTSGLEDVFFPLWRKMKKEKLTMTPREAVIWGKTNFKPRFIPGSRNYYGDTNYYLLGLIIESITNIPFHQAMHEHIFNPLGMDQAYIFGFSQPSKPLEYPMAKIRLDGIDVDTVPDVFQFDYAGGGVVAPLSQYFAFFKALVNGTIVKPETLDRMLSDTIRMGFPMIGFDYGYSVWKFRAIPLLLQKELTCWGCVGITGAFMFYHPPTQSYIIGSFNDMAYKAKGLRFMLGKVIKPLLKCI